MINKSEAPRTKDYINLDLIVAAITGLNKGNKDKYCLYIYERDETPENLSQPFMLHVELICNHINIHEKIVPVSKALNSAQLERFVLGNVCMSFIANCIGSGLINYKLTVDSFAESFAQ